MTDDDPFEVVDPSGLSDADWAEINKLQRVYKEGGKRALNRAMAALANDPIRFVAVVGAFIPDMIREAIKDYRHSAHLPTSSTRLSLVVRLHRPNRVVTALSATALGLLAVGAAEMGPGSAAQGPDCGADR